MRQTGKRALRVSALFAIFLGAVLASLVIALAYRLDLSWEAKLGAVRLVSDRTRDVLADTQGTVKISCFMDRRQPMFRHVSRLLRGLAKASRGVAGAEILIEYVDPRWDLTRAGQLAAWGVPENALLFERQRRRIVVTLDEMVSKQPALRLKNGGDDHGEGTGLGVFRGEIACASAIARLSLPYERSIVYWLQGHGEVRVDDYDELRGFSDIAREMKRDGFGVRPLSLPGVEQIPSDCQVLVVAGVRRKLAAEEVGLVESFLLRGGRLMFLAVPRVTTGLEPLLEKWGIRVTTFIAVSPQTISGQDVVVSSFGDHVIVRNLRNVSVAFGAPACLETVRQSVADGSVDRPQVTQLAWTGKDGWGESHPETFSRHFDAQSELGGPVSVAAVSERGGGVSRDVAYKPTRICVFGETDFVMNGTLAARANANRDLFMNALAWLAGIDTEMGPSLGGDATLVTGFTRRQWVEFVVASTVLLPVVFLLAFVLLSLRRRR